MVDRFRIGLHAYVLMDNHYHLMLELRESNLSRAGQWLNVSYSVWFNRRHGRTGHLFQGRFKSVVVDPIQWGLELSRYIHLNPVRVGGLGMGKTDRQRQGIGASGAPEVRVVKARIAHLRRYRWSSFRAYVGLERRPAWLECNQVLEWGGGKEGERTRNYREYVESALREGQVRSPWDELQEQVVLGGEQFLQSLRAHVTGNAREQRGVKRLAHARPTMQQLIASLEKLKGQPWVELRDRYGDDGRDLVLYVARRACGLTLVEIAAAVGMNDYSAVSIAIRRFERRLRQSKSSRARLRQLCELSNVEM